MRAPLALQDLGTYDHRPRMVTAMVAEMVTAMVTAGVGNDGGSTQHLRGQ